MKYIFVLLILLVTIPPSRAQMPYSWLGKEKKTYFINGKGYLRGMRIDSVLQAGQDTLFYPFPTARVRYGWGPQGDTLSGSWWGKVIVQNPDGVTFVQNKWGDTFVVRNNAALHIPWVCYHDSSDIYFQAEVVALDTMTFQGVTDTVKKIRLTAKEDTAVLSGHPLHNLELLLSREHGWITAIDFFLFPYHEPGGNAINHWLDCYFYESIGDEFGNIQSDIPFYLIFKRVDFLPPVTDEVYNWDVGDRFWHYNNFTTSPNWRITETNTTVTEKIVTATSLTYTYDYWSRSKGYNPPTAYSYGSGSAIFSVEKGKLLIDTLKMPEEWFNEYYYYYLPADTSYCYTSATYGVYTSKVGRNGLFADGAVEPSFPSTTYKNRVGITSSSTGGPLIIGPVDYRSIVAVKKGADPCDRGNNLLSVTQKDRVAVPSFQLVPNPASDYVEVRADGPVANFSLVIYNSIGAVMITFDHLTVPAHLYVGGLPEGIYFVRIYDNRGTGTAKLLIRR